MAENIERFLAHLASMHGASKSTIRAYHGDLRIASEWFPGPDAETQLCDAARPALLAALAAYQFSRGIGPARTRRLTRTLSSFYRYLILAGRRTDNPAIGLPSPRLPQRLPIALTAEQASAIIYAAGQLSPFPTCRARQRAIVATLIYTGLRISELCSLTMRNLDQDLRFLTVVGKGNRERTIPICPDLDAELRAWLLQRTTAGPHVFASAQGDAPSPRVVQRLVKRATLAAAIDLPITPHKLRHTFATLLHAAGADIVEISHLLGHSSLATTSIYTHTDTARLRSAVNLLSLPPLNVSRSDTPS